MKETPLLFTPENVRKVLAGTKTQTRRLNGLEEINKTPDAWTLDRVGSIDPRWGGAFVPIKGVTETVCISPYGGPGDRLYVRHAYNLFPVYFKPIIGYEGIYAARSPRFAIQKWACRLWLELTAVRVERVQEISEEDAKAEGFDTASVMMIAQPEHDDYARDWYAKLWDSINGAGSWESNPWVWKLTFIQL